MTARIATLTATVAAAALLATAPIVTRAEAPLDYDYFKAKVQPIFLTKRPDHARCVMCHAGANNMLHLQGAVPRCSGLGRGADPQELRHGVEDRAGSRRSAAEQDPDRSARAGGRRRRLSNSGGRQFADKNDPYWKTIADWAQGAKLK